VAWWRGSVCFHYALRLFWRRYDEKNFDFYRTRSAGFRPVAGDSQNKANETAGQRVVVISPIYNEIILLLAPPRPRCGR